MSTRLTFGLCVCVWLHANRRFNKAKAPPMLQVTLAPARCTGFLGTSALSAPSDYTRSWVGFWGTQAPNKIAALSLTCVCLVCWLLCCLMCVRECVFFLREMLAVFSSSICSFPSCLFPFSFFLFSFLTLPLASKEALVGSTLCAMTADEEPYAKSTAPLFKRALCQSSFFPRLSFFWGGGFCQ